MTAYYNEIDPYAAQWLRNLISKNLIAPGDVDERSIVDVQPDDLKSYTQCHFFAGIGGWSLAARMAGWPDDRPLWTGSCPCQPFSSAGKGEGKQDERHLWPTFFSLIRARRPAVVMGEQVAAAVGKDWLDGVHSDLESIEYSSGAAVVPACAVDAPHRRDRLWFVAHAEDQRRRRECRELEPQEGDGVREVPRQGDWWAQPGPGGENRTLAYTEQPDQRRHPRDTRGATSPRGREAWSADGYAFGGPRHARGSENDDPSSVADADIAQRRPNRTPWNIDDGSEAGWDEGAGYTAAGSRWIVGADGKSRRIEPSIRLLAHGVPARVGKLRAYGNAIVPQVAAEVIAAFMETYSPPGRSAPSNGALHGSAWLPKEQGSDQ